MSGLYHSFVQGAALGIKVVLRMDSPEPRDVGFRESMLDGSLHDESLVPVVGQSRRIFARCKIRDCRRSTFGTDNLHFAFSIAVAKAFGCIERACLRGGNPE